MCSWILEKEKKKTPPKTAALADGHSLIAATELSQHSSVGHGRCAICSFPPGTALSATLEDTKLTILVHQFGLKAANVPPRSGEYSIKVKAMFLEGRSPQPDRGIVQFSGAVWTVSSLTNFWHRSVRLAGINPNLYHLKLAPTLKIWSQELCCDSKSFMRWVLWGWLCPVSLLQSNPSVLLSILFLGFGPKLLEWVCVGGLGSLLLLSWSDNYDNWFPILNWLSF